MAEGVTARPAGASTRRTQELPPARRQRGGRHAAHRGSSTGGRPAPRLHVGRIAVLALVLIGASFYVSPLRAFFAQQDRYQHESAALAAAQATNDAYKLQVEQLSSKDVVAQVARADSMLVPPRTQTFVIKGLPKVDDEPAAAPAETTASGSFSVFDRLGDLWHTLLH